ncbi:MAG: hypothetical protein ACRC28_14220 [Clostridium sp.]|uniref:hypothetical protein n=1 Tax=Clostridium sp. TaxID=1506 RepID=UPI003F2A5A96
MYAYKKKGNITVVASVFLVMSLVFFCGIFKLIKYSIYGTEDLIIYRSGIEFEEKREKIIKVLQEYSNMTDMEEEKVYEYKNKEIELELASLYRVENLKISYKGKVAEIGYRNKDTKKVQKIKVYREKMKVCECEKEFCDFDSEKIILIPQKGVKKNV